VLELFEVEKITSVMATSKNNVAAGWIVAECTKHFWGGVNTQICHGSRQLTLNLMVGSLLALTDVNNTKEGLIDVEALCKRPKLRRTAKKSDLRQLHGQLLKT
jgi:hypothetical protein